MRAEGAHVRWNIVTQSDCSMPRQATEKSSLRRNPRPVTSIYFLRSAVFGILGSPYPCVSQATAATVVDQVPTVRLRAGAFSSPSYARRRERLEVWARCERSYQNSFMCERLAHQSAWRWLLLHFLRTVWHRGDVEASCYCFFDWIP